MREATLTAHRFPDPLRLGEGGSGNTRARQLTLIEDPLVSPIQKGEPILGWEGDERMALYVDHLTGEWLLVRFEHDGVYRVVVGVSIDAYSGHEIVPFLITWIVEHDTRRGFDPISSVIEHNARLDAENQSGLDALASEAADRVAHGIRKDGLV